MQIAIYDVAGNPLSPTVVEEFEIAVVKTIKRLKTENPSKYTTLAHSVVVE